MQTERDASDRIWVHPVEDTAGLVERELARESAPEATVARHTTNGIALPMRRMTRKEGTDVRL